ncbi:MAG: substrate-binding domain-containing protein [Pseudolabrys sp.]
MHPGSVSDRSTLFAMGGTNYSLNVIGHKLDLLRDNKTRENALGQLKQFMAVTFVLTGVAVIGVASRATCVHAQTASTSSDVSAVKTPAIPKNKETDIKFYPTSGSSAVIGKDALEDMPKAGLVLWLAGNQFFAMDDVVHAFQNEHPGVTVGVITLPPGLLLQAIKAGGWAYLDKEYRGLPDIYASVNLGHLKQLKASGTMDSYMVYMHNELQIMVAKGNPKKITNMKDLARDDVRTSMPNPVNEGIMQFYIRKVLERHGIWEAISGGKECVSCQTTKNNWFTAVHHRETPERIKTGQSDAGVVWKTEVLEAHRAGADVDAVTMPDEDSLRAEVAYVIGALKPSPRRDAADAFLSFLQSPRGQDAYAKFGFVKADEADLKLRPID